VATADAILTEFRSALAGIALSRDASLYFVESLEAAPHFKKDTGQEQFFVLSGEQVPGPIFGIPGDREDVLRVLVDLGFGDFGTEANRDTYLAKDVERVRNILEHRTWAASGIQSVFCESAAEPNRAEKSMWTVRLVFRVTYTGAVIAS
jgi:hypothetical protein